MNWLRPKIFLKEKKYVFPLSQAYQIQLAKGLFLKKRIIFLTKTYLGYLILKLFITHACN